MRESVGWSERMLGREEDEVEYRCGHCDRNVVGQYLTGFKRRDDGTCSITRPNLLSCPECKKDSVLYAAHKTVQPLPLLGDTVRHLPDDVGRAYMEARIAFSAGAYTACMLMCRNILAYAANHLGSGKRDRFTDYIDHLVNGNRINQAMKDWANDIRQHGNSAAHDLNLRDEAGSKQTLTLTMYLLKFLFEVDGEHEKGSQNLRSYTTARTPHF